MDAGRSSGDLATIRPNRSSISAGTSARKVRNELVHLNHTMRLENQAVTPDDLNGEERRLIGVYLTTLNRRLWDTE